DKYAYKLAWLRGADRLAERELVQHPRLIVLGDFNIAPEDRDVRRSRCTGRPKCCAARRNGRRSSALPGLGNRYLSGCFRGSRQFQLVGLPRCCISPQSWPAD
ncbi:MAG: hypothetical protein IPL59_11310, partial [Candidatus Competibacteraceae bacterium]|nr:hypothetical protein [Candidatus Competibacteraceae bacterium]